MSCFAWVLMSYRQKICGRNCYSMLLAKPTKSEKRNVLIYDLIAGNNWFRRKPCLVNSILIIFKIAQNPFIAVSCSMWVSFRNIHDSQDSRGSGRLSRYLLSTISTGFTDTQTLAGRLVRRAHRKGKQQPTLFLTALVTIVQGKIALKKLTALIVAPYIKMKHQQ